MRSKTNYSLNQMNKSTSIINNFMSYQNQDPKQRYTFVKNLGKGWIWRCIPIL